MAFSDIVSDAKRNLAELSIWIKDVRVDEPLTKFERERANFERHDARSSFVAYPGGEQQYIRELNARADEVVGKGVVRVTAVQEKAQMLAIAVARMVRMRSSRGADSNPQRFEAQKREASELAGTLTTWLGQLDIKQPATGFEHELAAKARGEDSIRKAGSRIGNIKAGESFERQ